MKLEHSLTPYAKIYSKWIKDLTVKHETIIFFKGNKGGILFDIIINNIFHMVPQANKTETMSKSKAFAKRRKPSTMGEVICKQHT